MATALPQIIHFQPEVNPTASRTWLQHIQEYSKTANGAFRILQLADRICKLVADLLKRMGNAMSVFFDTLAGKLSLAWGLLTTVRLWEVTPGGFAAAHELVHPKPNANFRSITKNIHDVLEGAAAWGYFLAIVLTNPFCKMVADVPDLGSNVCDLTLDAQTWSDSRQQLQLISSPANAPANAADPAAAARQQALRDTKTVSFMKMVKAAASIFSAVLGMLVLAFGGPILPALVFIGLGLTSTISAIAAHFWKETALYKPVDISAIRQPIHLHTA